MRTGALLLMLAGTLAGCTKTPATTTTTATSTNATTATTTMTAPPDNRSIAEKAGGAGLRAKDKAEELKREADAKAKEVDATNE